tara:strand:- start:272 stop:589 length:318 start_codon:yes stop_codon:yes gene_type:complete
MGNSEIQNIDENMDINNLDNIVFSENNYIEDNVEINDDSDLENDGIFEINNQLFLKAILFSMVYYIISSPLLKLELKRHIPTFIDINFFQALLFGTLFYLISINL